MFFHYPWSRRGSPPPKYPSPPTNSKLSGRRQPTTDTVAAERFTRNGKFMFFSRANVGQLRLRVSNSYFPDRIAIDLRHSKWIDFSFDLTIRRLIFVDVSPLDQDFRWTISKTIVINFSLEKPFQQEFPILFFALAKPHFHRTWCRSDF